jgi:hypothetical protein
MCVKKWVLSIEGHEIFLSLFFRKKVTKKIMEIKHRRELMRKANTPWLAAQTAADFHRPPHA